MNYCCTLWRKAMNNKVKLQNDRTSHVGLSGSISLECYVNHVILNGKENKECQVIPRSVISPALMLHPYVKPYFQIFKLLKSWKGYLCTHFHYSTHGRKRWSRNLNFPIVMFTTLLDSTLGVWLKMVEKQLLFLIPKSLSDRSHEFIPKQNRDRKIC